MSNWIGWTLRQMMLDTEERIADYEKRKLDKTWIKGIGISTIWADDFSCYETALLDANGVHPVERYDTEAKALRGHKKWIGKVEKGIKKVTKLGTDDGWVEDKTIILKPRRADEKSI